MLVPCWIWEEYIIACRVSFVYEVKVNDFGGFVLRNRKPPLAHRLDCRLHQNWASSQYLRRFDRTIGADQDCDSHSSVRAHPLGQIRVTRGDPGQYLSLRIHLGQGKRRPRHRRPRQYSCNAKNRDLPHARKPDLSRFKLKGAAATNKVAKVIGQDCNPLTAKGLLMSNLHWRTRVSGYRQHRGGMFPGVEPRIRFLHRESL